MYQNAPRNVSRNVGQVQQQGQVQYEIKFPQSLHNNIIELRQAKESIAEELQFIANIEDNPQIGITIGTSVHHHIRCEVNTRDQYFLLSQLQLLKMKYIEYGIYLNALR